MNLSQHIVSEKGSLGRFIVSAAGLAVALAVGLFVLGTLSGCSSEAVETEEVFIPSQAFTVTEKEYTPPQPKKKKETNYTPTSKDLSKLSNQADPYAFATQSGDKAPELSKDTISTLKASTKTLTDKDCNVGYLLVNLKTGRGIASNIDERVFGASAIKAPFVLFICEELLDKGETTLDSKVGGSTVQKLAEAAVIKSDNDANTALHNAFGYNGWDEWLTKLGIGSGFNREQRTPFYTARESALMWLEMYRYINSDAEHASWMKSLISDTEVSFMRHALQDEGVKVMNKAGWYNGAKYDSDDSGWCEAGIITKGKEAYLLTLMTDLPYEGEDEYVYEELIRDLFAARSELK